ncbi:DUF4343 domain-containing protein [Bacillus paranthracis]|uniref:ATP-grasp domain-containing protein n=1 Tax=Bacillus paranthracis TaxID=2026186 RepID=UPI001879541F|nr:ATP-grasp domain-containing protein [Bacillus paranthracis]MBE7114350.1 DUF4343 domain-containing protein [Bacillus paranthracis]MBE7154777.1 DUF4343 domain-containing protein [Bacillus paranthracis]
MRWLVQEFLNKGENSVRMAKALDECNTEYLLVKIEEDNTLTVLDKETKVPVEGSDGVLNNFTNGHMVVVYGSKTLSDIAKTMGLYPGTFHNENFEFDVFRGWLGNELVNHDFVCGELQELTPIADKFFIRPTGNTKLFTGQVVTREEFLDWQERENREGSPYEGQRLMMSPVRELLSEYRFFVVNQRVITGSSYQVNGKPDVTKPISGSLLNYVEGRVFEFWVADSYVIDVAETPDGFKVVEYNNTNTSGLYGCDEVAIVQAINKIQEG